ncbi:hypothetical protein B4099_3190 [Heyndrickxia coagulans]|uniref:Uncharacterized protein n=1 Tax=Heyndrickxia coagulans TaxID=1398 RepID=A0A150KH34_HEYCO|nr:hypothetical protein B4099_3190 [Heyndrickxia coagulans]
MIKKKSFSLFLSMHIVCSQGYLDITVIVRRCKEWLKFIIF